MSEHNSTTASRVLFFIGYALILILVCQATVRANPERDARFEAKVRSAVSKLGVGPEVTVKVKLRDKTKLAGYIDEARETDFTIINKESGVSTTVLYSQVKQIKGKNNLTGEQVALIAGVAVVLVLLFLFASG